MQCHSIKQVMGQKFQISMAKKKYKDTYKGINQNFVGMSQIKQFLVFHRITEYPKLEGSHKDHQLYFYSEKTICILNSS